VLPPTSLARASPSIGAEDQRQPYGNSSGKIPCLGRVSLRAALGVELDILAIAGLNVRQRGFHFFGKAIRYDKFVEDRE
jgi:hypothetical protein